MCPLCFRLLNGFCLPHPAERCPLKQGLYCARCASYGHAMGKCPSIMKVQVATKEMKNAYRIGKRKGVQVVFLPPQQMKRSFFLSRRLHHRPHHRRPRQSRHTRHTSHTRHTHRKHPRHPTRRHRSRSRGGAIGETVNTMNGIPVSENALVTNSKGVTRSVKNRVMPLNDAETSELLGYDDI